MRDDKDFAGERHKNGKERIEFHLNADRHDIQKVERELNMLLYRNRLKPNVGIERQLEYLKAGRSPIF